MAPSAISNLRTAVLSLFQGNDNSGDDDGNQPVNPAPNAPISGIELRTGKELTGQTSTVYFEYHLDTAAPDGTYWDFASPLLCQMEDCPAESLKGQAYELLCDREDKGERFCELVQVSPTVAYQRKFDGEVICTYAGFRNKTIARR